MKKNEVFRQKAEVENEVEVERKMAGVDGEWKTKAGAYIQSTYNL